jgi:hypothetical protein
MPLREHYSVELAHLLFGEELKSELIATSSHVIWGKRSGGWNLGGVARSGRLSEDSIRMALYKASREP